MALPTKTEQETLDFISNGRPALCVEAKALSSETLDIISNGRPAYATAASAPPAPTGLFSWWAWSQYGASNV